MLPFVASHPACPALGLRGITGVSILQSRATFLGISAGRRFLKLKVELLLPKGPVTHLVSAKSFASCQEQSSE